MSDTEAIAKSRKMLSRLGDRSLDDELDKLRRYCLEHSQTRLAEEARAWLEFSRATARFYDRLKKGRNP